MTLKTGILFIKFGSNLVEKLKLNCFKAICCYSVAQSCLTLCEPMDPGMPGFAALHHLLELAQTHVHSVSDVIQHLYPFYVV